MKAAEEEKGRQVLEMRKKTPRRSEEVGMSKSGSRDVMKKSHCGIPSLHFNISTLSSVPLPSLSLPRDDHPFMFSRHTSVKSLHAQ